MLLFCHILTFSTNNTKYSKCVFKVIVFSNKANDAGSSGHLACCKRNGGNPFAMVSVQLIANQITGIYSNQSFKCSFTNFAKAIDTILTQASDTPLALGFIAAV